jgi:phage terminase large subunit-like protein
MARLYSVQHLFAEGMVYAPDRAWADQVITQCAQFPRAKHDDIVDTVSQALRHLRTAGLLTRSAEHLQQIEEGSRVKNTLKPLYDV